jgi:hypothetical protein
MTANSQPEKLPPILDRCEKNFHNMFSARFSNVLDGRTGSVSVVPEKRDDSFLIHSVLVGGVRRFPLSPPRGRRFLDLLETNAFLDGRQFWEFRPRRHRSSRSMSNNL